MTSILSLIMNPRILGILGIVILVGALYVQTNRLAGYRDANQDLNQQIIDLKAAAELAETLRAKNEELNLALGVLRGDLRNAESYNTYLPDDIRDVLRRLHNE